MTKLQQIRARCLECVDGQAEVRACAFFACPLWPFRMGKNPYPLSDAQIRQRAEAAEKSPLKSLGGQMGAESPDRVEPPSFRGPNEAAHASDRVSLDRLRSWAWYNLPAEMVNAPDPREMTLVELQALIPRRLGPADALRRDDWDSAHGVVARKRRLAEERAAVETADQRAS